MIETPPKIIIETKEYKVKKGEDVTLEVKYTARPQPTDEWIIDGMLIRKSDRMTPKLTESSASLTITQVEFEDGGNYTIKLRNNCGEASAELTLTLMGKLILDFHLFQFVCISNLHENVKYFALNLK